VIASQSGRESGMKLLIGILIFVWFACGLFGAWRLGDMSLKKI